MTYGKLIAGLKKADIDLDRKILADIAVRDAATFAQHRRGRQNRLTRPAQSRLGTLDVADARGFVIPKRPTAPWTSPS